MLTAIVPHDLPGQPHPRFPSTDDGFILDSNYNVYDTVDMRGDSLRPNMHDLTVFNNGSRALMITQKTYDQSVLRIGEFNRPCNLGWQGFREIDLETGKVLFEWDAEGKFIFAEYASADSAFSNVLLSVVLWVRAALQVEATVTMKRPDEKFQLSMCLDTVSRESLILNLTNVRFHRPS